MRKAIFFYLVINAVFWVSAAASAHIHSERFVAQMGY